jgi:hypothetical protein
VSDPGRTATRVIIAALLISLAATIFLVVQNSDAWGNALLVTLLCALALIALPAVLVEIEWWRTGRPTLPRARRSAVYASSAILMLLGGLWIYSVREGVWLIPGAMLVAFGILSVVRTWRAGTLPDSPRGVAHAGSVSVGMLLILVAIVAVPKMGCGCTKTKAYTAAMKSDLRNLVVAQEAFMADSGRFASTSDLGDFYRTTSGVTLVRLVPHGSTSWYALVQHSSAAEECGIWVGKRPPDGMHGAKEGEPMCWPAPWS